MRRIIDDKALRLLNFKSPATWVATWGGCGLIRPAPGTWGTLGAMPFGIVLLIFGGVPALVIAAIILFPIGLWASKQFEKMVNEKDSGMIVVDEVVGVWIALIPAMLSPLSIALAFILFRFFDILKPWPIAYFDKHFKGAFGVMIDDVIAGVFAAIILIGLRYVGIG